MKNLTVSIHDETYIEARIWALRRGTSVSALVERFLQTLNESVCPGLAFSDGGLVSGLDAGLETSLDASLDALDRPPHPPIYRGAVNWCCP
jgi:hypothetical protein